MDRNDRAESSQLRYSLIPRFPNFEKRAAKKQGTIVFPIVLQNAQHENKPVEISKR